MEKILTDKTGNKKAIATPDYKFKTFKELQKDLDSADQKIKKFPPPVENKKNTGVKTDNGKGGVTDKSFTNSLKGGVNSNSF
tara:strand:- start:349 stop:594 length:246 start_codon:yes stop_codon:yes gene_type:complete